LQLYRYTFTKSTHLHPLFIIIVHTSNCCFTYCEIPCCGAKVHALSKTSVVRGFTGITL
jgi:hypothetical protein